MEKMKERALTYSLLAHIRTKGQLVRGPIEVFIPIIKRALSKLNEKGIYSGKSITEIKEEADRLYSIDFPIPVLRSILSRIANQVNNLTDRYFELFQDDSFQIKNYAFTEFEDTIKIHSLEIDNIENLFREFCLSCGKEKIESTSILDFIDKNRISLSKYLSDKSQYQNDDYSIEAQFVEFFKKIPPVYETIRKIYLGSIIVGYLEYKTENVKTGIELLIDTNFLLGILDLNTPESTHTCRKIIEITKNQGYKLSILRDTIFETISLLKAKVENFNTTFLQKKIFPEDVYNACDRRKLNSNDLERIADNLEKTISSYGIFVVFDTTKYKNIAKYSKEYEILKKYRHTEPAALHDATAIHYVREKRGKRIKDFENVNCWFINNSISREKYSDTDRFENLDSQPEMIKADDFLNIIWLSSPQIQNSLDVNEVADIGLSSLVSIGLSSNLPKLSIIRELDENIQKYASDGELKDSDILKIATRITTKQFTDIDDLNRLAKEKKEKFIQRLNDEAKKQKEIEDERIRKIDTVLKEFIKKSDAISKIKSDLEKKTNEVDQQLVDSTELIKRKDKTIEELKIELSEERKSRTTDENKRRKKLREDLIEKKIKNWRRAAYIELGVWAGIIVISLIILLSISDWKINKAFALYSQLKVNAIFSTVVVIIGIIFSGFTIKKMYDRNHNYSNIENYKKNVKIPEEYYDIE